MIYDQLTDLLKEHKPDTAAVEKLFFARNVTTGIAVGQARGVVFKLWLGESLLGKAKRGGPRHVHARVVGISGPHHRREGG